MKHSQELTELKEHSLVAQRDLQLQLETKSRQVESDSRQQVLTLCNDRESKSTQSDRDFILSVQHSQLQSRVDELVRKNAELTEARYNLENQVQQLTSSLRAHQAELGEAKV